MSSLRRAAACATLISTLLAGCATGVSTTSTSAAPSNGTAASGSSGATSTTGSGSGGSGSSGNSGASSGSGSGGGSGSSGSGGSGSTSGTVSVATASRLLDQATFGPTTDSIAHVQALGVQAWLTEQYGISQTTLPALPSPLPTQCPNTATPCFESEFWQAVLTAPDQLRQRVAFTLGELFVTSTQSVNPLAILSYHNTLSADALGNWRTLMEDVTLSPAMGLYLNMIQSGKPATGQHANENFAREMLQLFSIGLYKLNMDGTLQLDASGKPIPTYTEAQIQAFADTYTGWTYATSTGTAPTKFPNNTANYSSPLMPVDSAHDTSPKTLLNGTAVVAGGTARGDLKIALDTIFNDPSLPPFICKQLIQHLVTSTPSNAYIQRVSTVFANNGSGVRGDMKAVLTAILTDSEARAGDTNASYDGGHLREPMLYLTGAMRALGFANTNSDSTDLWSYRQLSGYTAPLNEQPLHSPSVFNFYPPEYVVPSSTLNAPEFSLENTASVNLRLTLANSLSQGKLTNFAADFSKAGTLGTIAADPQKLVDTLSVLLMHGQMPSAMRTVIVSTITPLTDKSQRVRFAVYLILSSSLYKVMH